ncbi:hypothetical protein KSF78_0004354 [Schistosoma japonicum]|nr:hypothetical protein KSF78_0004354 [Schistosoma japonicum]
MLEQCPLGKSLNEFPVTDQCFACIRLEVGRFSTFIYVRLNVSVYYQGSTYCGTYNMQLLESVGNLRPIHKPKLTNYAKSHSTNKLKTSHQTLPTPSIRLRLDEAIENAKRNRQSNVFPSQNSNISNLPWRKLKKPIAGNYDSDSNLNSSEVSQMSQYVLNLYNFCYYFVGCLHR